MTSFPKYSLGSSTEARQTAVAVLRHRVRLGHQEANVAVSYPAVRVWGRGGDNGRARGRSEEDAVTNTKHLCNSMAVLCGRPLCKCIHTHTKKTCAGHHY